MAKPEPWRRTGRRAKEEHFLGLADGTVLEVSVYDDRGNPQGRAVLQLWEKCMKDEKEEGYTWRGKFLAIEDGYYEWWATTTHPSGMIPFHLCERNAHQCRMTTVYRDPIHVDVFRVLPEKTFLDLAWLKDAHRDQALKIFVEAPPSGTGDAGTGSAGPGKPGVGGVAPDEVKTGSEGIAGLAAALGGRAPPPHETTEEERRKKRRSDDGGEEDKKKRAHDLKMVITGRKASEPVGSALKMQNEGKKKSKKKKKSKDSKDKTKRRKKEKEDDVVDGSSSDVESSTSDSSEESVFRLAALPEGVDRLQRIHLEKPGALADMTLRRFQELLARSIGGGAATETTHLPAVARAYLNQIYLVKNNENVIGLRNLRELRTLTTLIDYMASNDVLRAMDVAVQRVKAIELFISQGQWSQANLLELVLPEDEQRAWFRQELKAAQQEHKSELRMQQDQWPRRRNTWYPNQAPVTGGEKKDNEAREDHPPSNGGSKGKKGKGKGRKGKMKW